MKFGRRASVFAIVLAAWAGCRDSAQSTKDTTPTETGQRAGTYSVDDTVAGLHIPVLLQADGKESVAIDDLRGSTVVLEFWATWCGPCVEAIDHLNEVADQFATSDNIRFISVTDENRETVTDFLARTPIRTWIGIDEDQQLHKAFEINSIPQTIIIGPDGKLAARTSPSKLDAELLDRIQNRQKSNGEPSNN